MLGGLVALVALQPAPAPGAQQPLAVRGGVLMVPLTSKPPDGGWERTIPIQLGDGSVIDGVVAWIHPAASGARRHWTDDPRGLAVRAIRPDDGAAEPIDGTTVLLARLPRDGDGPLRVGPALLEPRWLDAPAAAPAERPLELVQAPDRPDPRSPLEYWRWVLLAEQLGRGPPAAEAFGEVPALVAEHYAGLWQVALQRLERLDAGLAQKCRRLLTRTGLDGQQPLASWVADAKVVGELVTALLDFQSPETQVAAAAALWADRQHVAVFQQVPPGPDAVSLAMVNSGAEPLVCRFRWMGSPDLAMSAVANPGRLSRADIVRPAEARPRVAPEAGLEADRLQVLQMEAAGLERTLVFGPGLLVAEPPGILLSALRAPLTLADAQSGRPGPVASERSTIVQVRKLNGRWEVFAECRRPPGAPPRGNLAAAVDASGTRGVEAVTVLLGGDPAYVELTVPERGRYRLFRGRNDGTLEIHRRSYDDRWYCRVVLPELWLTVQPGRLRVGLLRTHGDSDAMETGPFASLPWRIAPGRAVIDTTQWDHLPVGGEGED